MDILEDKLNELLRQQTTHRTLTKEKLKRETELVKMVAQNNIRMNTIKTKLGCKNLEKSYKKKNLLVMLN